MEYFLRSKRLGFRCWTKEDLPLAIELWGDPEVTALMGGPFTPDAVHARLTREIELMKGIGFQYWPMFLLEDDRHVGCAGLRDYCEAEGVFEFGYHLRREFWGQGLATEAGRAVIEHVFREPRVEALFAGHHPLNGASRQVLLKLGLSFAGEKVYPPTGILEPTYLLHKHKAKED